jgi:hypothetical protein
VHGREPVVQPSARIPTGGKSRHDQRYDNEQDDQRGSPSWMHAATSGTDFMNGGLNRA